MSLIDAPNLFQMILNLLTICLALVFGVQGGYIINDSNQIETRKLATQDHLQKAVVRFAATARGLSGITEVVMRAVER